MCFGGRKERKLCLKIRLFGFPDVLVSSSAPWLLSARDLIQTGQSELRMKPPCEIVIYFIGTEIYPRKS